MQVLLFSVGEELFASPLATIEASLDRPTILAVPGADEHVLGVIDVRGRRIAAYSPALSLNVPLTGEAGAALVIEEGGSPIALLISDVEDVVELDPSGLRIAPGSDDPDGILLGVFQHEGKLVSVVDALAIRDVCLGAGARR